ncbi:unnamed protein product [Amoebophrya sp. A120]|nr:unnamed protein product [Amoebophrya sp. A120]|eukprot:GSA120T00004600001.1
MTLYLCCGVALVIVLDCGATTFRHPLTTASNTNLRISSFSSLFRGLC